MTKKNWCEKAFVCCLATMSLWTASLAQADEVVTRSGEYADDVFATGGRVSIDARMLQDLFVAGDMVEISGQVKGDVFAAGGRLELDGDVAGGLLVAGGRVKLGGEIKDGIVVFGGNVDINSAIDGDVLFTAGKADLSGPVNGDVRGSGGKISLHRSVAGNVLLGGGKIEIGDSVDISGKATIGAATLYVGGHIRRGLKAGAREIVIAGVIDGNVKLVANKITLLPSARIGGDLVYRSPQAIEFDDTTQVKGDVTFIQSEDMRHTMGRVFIFAGLTHLVFVAGIILIAGLIIFLAPPMLPALENRIKARRWKGFWLGLAFIIATPIVMTLLTLTAVGFPLALILAALYFVMIKIGVIVGAYSLSQKAFTLAGQDFRNSAWKQFAAAACGLAFLGLFTVVPGIGVIMISVATAFGIGAMLSAGTSLCRGHSNG